MNPPPILVIAGPTASGKSAVALKLAQELDAEIVNADSIQVYRGFDIGSAKATVDERKVVRHHLVDILDPPDFIDAVIYAEHADAAIHDAHSRGKRVILTGGTGLWIRATVRGLLDLPPPNPEIRSRLEQACAERGSPALHSRLRAIDPVAAEAIHPNDAMRVVRALEIFEQTGEPVGKLRAQHALGAPRYPTLFAVLESEAEALTARIERRLDAMLAQGLIDEVRGLLDRWPRTARAFGSVGYCEVVEHLRDGLPFDEMKRRIRKATRIYARRQRTWFRNEPGVNWRTSAAGLLAGLNRIAAHFSSTTMAEALSE